MKKTKKLLSISLIFFSILFILGCNSSNNQNGSDNCIHSYAETLITPTCLTDGYILHTCTKCKNSYKDSFVDKKEHNYNISKIDEDVVKMNCKNCNSEKTLNFSTGLKYKLSDDKLYYILTGIGNCKDKFLIIPPTINDRPLKIIAQNAFVNSNIEELYIVKNVEVIEHSAFANCLNLKKIYLSDDTKQIEEDAFFNTAYYNNEENWNNDCLYISDFLIEVRDTYVGSLKLKESTKGIAQLAFCDCGTITDIYISTNIKNINQGNIFQDCDSLANIYFYGSKENLKDKEISGLFLVNTNYLIEDDENYKIFFKFSYNKDYCSFNNNVFDLQYIYNHSCDYISFYIDKDFFVETKYSLKKYVSNYNLFLEKNNLTESLIEVNSYTRRFSPTEDTNYRIYGNDGGTITILDFNIKVK